jgi:hypothetical protein
MLASAASPDGLVDVYAASIPDFPFKAGVHVHYQESVLPIRDGVSKLKDVPSLPFALPWISAAATKPSKSWRQGLNARTRWLRAILSAGTRGSLVAIRNTREFDRVLRGARARWSASSSVIYLGSIGGNLYALQ